MNISLRSYLTAGVATITAAAVAFGPTVHEPRQIAPPPSVVQVVSQPVQLTAAVQPAAPVQPLAVTDLPNLLVGWLQRIIVPPSATQPFPTPPSAPGPVPSSLPSTLEWAYHAVEPWVRYGFELATYAAGWVPYVGWLSGQIMIFYNLGESITHAIVHNTLDFLNGNGSFLFNVGEGIAWSINALIQFGIAEWNYFLPPLPPLPPFPFAAQAQATTQTAEALTTTAVADTTQVSEKHSAVKGEDVEGPAAETAGDSTVKATKEPKAPKEPESATEATKQTEGDSASNDESTDTPKATDKKADKGPKAGTESSPSPKDKGDAKKSDDNGSKKGDKE